MSMDVRRIRKQLPGATVTRNGRKISVRQNGLGYTFDSSSGSEKQMSDYLRSKIPTAVLLPPPS